MPYSSADRRAYLIRPWSLSLMVVAVLIVLALLMPRSSFLSNPELIGRPDALSVAYLQALLKANPGDDEIRMLFAEHLAETGRIDEAYKQLQSVDPASIADANRVTFLGLRLSLLRLLKQPKDMQLRQRAGKAVEQAFALPNNMISVSRWQQLAGLLLQVGMPEWAARAYERLALLDREHKQHWLTEAGRWYLAAGKSERAADIQLHLAGIQSDVEEARKAIEYLLTANQPRRAMRVLPKFIRQFPEDRDLIQKGMQTAMATGVYGAARRWAQNWLVRHPEDAPMMQELIQLELASGHPKAAYPWAKRLVVLEPSDIERREQLARISEWTGHANTALRQWQWLVEHRHKRHDLQRALALANALNDYAEVDRLLAKAASEYGLTEAQVSNLAWVQEKLGNPRQSEQARLAYLKKSPNDRAAWEELATIREYMGKLSEAAATWEKIEQRFGRSETTVVQRARMLSASGQPEQGLQLMRQYAERRHPTSESFWQVYGDLAWNLEYHADAFTAYRWLWDHDKSGSFEAQRLMILLREEGNVEMTLRISKQAWQRFHDPDVLLLAIESAIQVQRWSDVSRLMQVAEALPDIFRDRRRYWLAHAQWSAHENHLDVAEQDYRLALNLMPGDADARSGLLWVWIQTNQRRKLKRYLPAWQRDAARHEIYWQAYAAAYRQLGRSRASLPWFRKFMQAHPDDVLWMLEYADALADAGQASGAWRLRRYLFARLWPKSRLNPEYVQNNGMRVVEAVASLKQRLQGLPKAQQWVNPLLRHSDDPVVREFAMRWYFGIERQEQAEYWLMRQHGMRMQAPAWQHLALAMERNDLDQIQRLLSGGRGLDHASTLLAYRQLHMLDDAWVLAMDTGLGAGEFRPLERTTMLRHARDLDALSPNAVHLGFSFDHFGALNLNRWGGKWFYSRDNHTLSVKGGLTRLDADTGFANLGGANREYELQLGTGFEFRHGSAMAYVGVNDRSTGVIDGGRLGQWGGSLKWRPWQGGETGIALAFRETSLETSGFRLIGARDRLQLSASSDITSREYLATHLNLNRFHTRRGEPIGRGYALDAVFGHRLQLANSLAEEQMQVRLSGELVSNRLEPVLTPWAQQLLPGATVSSVMPRSFASLGVGFNVQRDRPGNDEAVARTPIYLFDTWIGWQWPGSTLAYSISVGAGMPLFGRDMLSLRAYVANSVVGSISNESLYGVSLWYSYRFGR